MNLLLLKLYDVLLRTRPFDLPIPLAPMSVVIPLHHDPGPGRSLGERYIL
jgi:hypothetical protein